jgi:uncharacterized membrane protein
MWKKTFIRLMFVMLVATLGILVVAAANNKVVRANKECAATEEKCAGKEDKGQGDFIIWESLSRTVLSAVQY